MANIQTILQLLVENLEQKINLYEKIMLYSQEQQQLFQKGGIDTHLSKELFTNKQKAIDAIKVLDQVFETTFQRVKGIVQAEPTLYAEQIEHIQHKINSLMLLSLEIKSAEEYNKRTILTSESKELNITNNTQLPNSSNTLAMMRKDALLNSKKS